MDFCTSASNTVASRLEDRYTTHWIRETRTSCTCPHELSVIVLCVDLRRCKFPQAKKESLLESIETQQALFIKLGRRDHNWEKDCIDGGTLRLGYRDLPHDLCASSDWANVKAAFPEASDPGSVTRHVKQVRLFYEAPKTTLWITFHSDRLWWTFANPEVIQLSDKTKVRRAIEKWRDTDINGLHRLIKGRLSGKLLAVQGFQGTICSVLSWIIFFTKSMGLRSHMCLKHK